MTASSAEAGLATAARWGGDIAELIDQAIDGVVLVDEGGRVRRINTAAERLWGVARAAVLGGNIGRLLPAALLQAGAWAEHAITRPDGRRLWLSISVSQVHLHGHVCRAVLARDTTTSKLHEELQSTVLEAMARERPLLEVMDLVCREVERIAPEVIASILSVDGEQRLRPLAAPSLPEHYTRAIDGLAAGPLAGSCGTAAFRGEPVLVTDIATDPLWAPYAALALPLGLAACWSSPIKNPTGQVIGTFAFYYRTPRGPDAVHCRLVELCVHLCALALERDAARHQLHRLAFFDTLTGLPNRVLLNTLAEPVFADAVRTGQPLAALFIDLDRFKLINDARGHATGDTLLREVARRLAGEARGSDIAGRLSGDEFVLLLPRCTGLQAAAAAERLLQLLARPVDLDGLEIAPSASIGVALYPEDGGDLETLLRHADIAMVRAKTDRRGSFRFFRAEMNEAQQERVALEVDLRAALRDGGLRLHYQPQVIAGAAPAGRRLYGVEALLRWPHPQRGPIAPDRVVALAEDCGLINDLARWVLGEACRQLADWQRRGVPVPRVSVNLSASNFRDTGLPALVSGLLAQLGLTPGCLTLEMTESVMLDNDPRVLAGVHAFHAMGVGLSLDDFGTGYSSLSCLHRLPIGELKLDKSFVQDIEASESARALIGSMLRIGESLRMQVVAEGVETPAQREFLTERGCEVLQGYLLARPWPADEVERWLGASPAGAGSLPC
ncbi:MAG TPA: EAL domain-containing protein [Ideonella sp.]|nr:EAL domain-containing protein [Ideonella sp.]